MKVDSVDVAVERKLGYQQGIIAEEEHKKANENVRIHYFQTRRKSGVTAQKGKTRIRWEKKKYKNLIDCGKRKVKRVQKLECGGKC